LCLRLIAFESTMDSNTEMKREKKDEESGGNPYAKLDVTAVLQECRAFNETPINARKCSIILTKLFHLVQQGDNIGRTEATEAFFGVTKLWQSKDATLRRLVYLAVKVLSTISDDVIIVTSSLTKDMTGKEDAYRAPAIRALCLITDAAMLQTIERYMKQAIVDRNQAVSSAALVSSIHLMKKAGDVVRRWANEVQEAASADGHMVQLHALALLYQIRSNDRLAVNKLVQKFAKGGMRSPFALCYLIRIAKQLIEEDDQADSSFFQFIDSCLRHKSEMVVYEAASAMVSLPNTSPSELAPAISVLQLFCSSPKPALRFAAVRTLNKVSVKHPQAVTSCNVDLEKLITDSNRSIATLAITTLLKTGAESSVERLMKQISSFVSEISDEFKIVVVEAIRALIARYPRKHTVMLPFLANMLRNDGGFEYKREIVDTLIAIVEENPDARLAGLAQLCEFIEDCEHPALATKVLHLLGREAPKTANPHAYIRFVYNRVILETTQVRAAAVSALAKIGAQCPQLRPSIEGLLKNCLLDSEDEVRDRATFYLSVLDMGPSIVNSLVLDTLQSAPAALERAAAEYVENEEAHSSKFDLKSVPVCSAPMAKKAKTLLTEEVAPAKEKKTAANATAAAADRLSQIEGLTNGLGPLFKSTLPVPLTDNVNEYTVQCSKHIFGNHVILEFEVKNTLNDQLLEQVNVSLEDAEGEWKVLRQRPIARLPYGEPSSIFVLLPFPDGVVQGVLGATLNFKVKDVDPTTGEPESDDTYDDSYVLEEVELSVSDSVQPLAKASFGPAWNGLEEGETVEETFSLSTVSSIHEAIKKVCGLLGLAPCERSDIVPEGRNRHAVMMSGVFRGGFEVLAKANVAIDPSDNSIGLNLLIRSPNPTVSEILASAI
ncbi:hypothetical protein PENTCL1PPCAC_18307, partial [Pristionchus entomophagus]